jgi:anion-transporting  ArsA/GET3 family ATPase
MRTIFFTGNSGPEIALTAAATAGVAAQSGLRTLLVSIGPAHALPILTGEAVGNEPQEIAPNLSVWALDVLEDVSNFWEQTRTRLSGSMPLSLSGDELPIVPGMDLLLGLERLRRRATTGYDLVAVAVGPQDLFLRTLSVPDSFRWGLRLLFGLDRGPGRNPTSLHRALVPTALLPLEWFNQVQTARVELERLRDAALDPTHTTVRYILRPDAAALEEAYLAVPALQLHGLVVDALIAGPLLPADTDDARLTAVAARQQELTSAAAHVWASRPLLRLPLRAHTSGVADLQALGAELYAGRRAEERYVVSLPIEQNIGDDPFIAIDLPGLRREALGLTLSGDELIVRAGPYRRHLLMPETLRGTSNIRANREGDRLVVRLRR